LAIAIAQSGILFLSLVNSIYAYANHFNKYG
jgi:hypothetical protein